MPSHLWTLALALASAVAVADPASAVVRQFDFSIATKGVPNAASGRITLDFDYAADTGPTSTGLTTENFNFVLDGPVQFLYAVGTNRLIFGNNCISVGCGVYSSANDFALVINSASTSPQYAFADLSQAGQGIIDTGNPSGTISTVSAVPLPASASLLGGALALLLGAHRRRGYGRA